jgi:hypothetical protein
LRLRGGWPSALLAKITMVALTLRYTEIKRAVIRFTALILKELTMVALTIKYQYISVKRS